MASPTPTARPALEAALAGFAEVVHQHGNVLGLLANRFHLGPTDLRALLFLNDNNNVTPKQLGSYLELTTGAMTPLIDRLDRAGTAHRLPHPEDRRSSVLHLTPEGRHIAEQLIDVYRDAFDTAIEPRHLSIFATTLTTIGDSLAATAAQLVAETEAA
jgi:DNA-binding MarR family transcriptional regulator